MVASVSGASRAIIALCSVIAAHGGFAVAAGTQADVGSCLNKAGIENSVPTTTTWTMDIQPWNSRVNPVPAAVAFPKTEKEVSAALKCAASAGVKVTTLGGNRSFSSMGFGRNDGALVINLKALKHLKYDPSTKLLSYGGPVMISEAANHMWNKYKRTLPHGRCPDVGMTGVAASGFGTLSRSSGTVLDNIESVRVALANGTIVDADAKRNSHVYWAGAITSFISHACKPNADFVELHNRSKVNVLVGMIKNVKAGAQITMHYGNVTWFKWACYKCWDGSDDDRVSKD
ncbi:hypothetical protein PPTG_19662 [Phytophthora nicotianae INRA-310]|uniref:FAD-binding PCMH-type domain-containing protein n=1 Tax=Phytophthora nicotianae (strain INRA-310) TaxID=761204 RepID=W2PBN2_PHYN3|nr:hypothetical protein PPTG_19662 [Phytophthora nicotianae INRA-310]ETM98241.1 hypothetical protein PPTG_19662 [Phytophthora nicotianae INRA-310]